MAKTYGSYKTFSIAVNKKTAYRKGLARNDVFCQNLAAAGYAVSRYEYTRIREFLAELFSLYGDEPSVGDIYPFMGTSAASQAVGVLGNDLTKNGTISHGLYGSKGDGATGYWDTGLRPIVNCTLIAAPLGYTSDNKVIMGAATATSQDRYWLRQVTNAAINGFQVSDERAASALTGTGGIHVALNVDEGLYHYFNGSLLASDTDAQGTVVSGANSEVYLLAYHIQGGGGNSFCNENVPLGLAAMLPSVDISKQADLYSIIREYLLAVGRLPITASTSAADAATNYINRVRIDGKLLSSNSQVKLVDLFTEIVNQSALGNLVDGYILSSDYNAENPSTITGLIGTKEGTIVNGPTYGAAGMTFNPNSQQYIDLNDNMVEAGNSYTLIGRGVAANTSVSAITLASFGIGKGAVLGMINANADNWRLVPWDSTGSSPAAQLSTYTATTERTASVRGDGTAAKGDVSDEAVYNIAGNYTMRDYDTSWASIGANRISSGILSSYYNGTIHSVLYFKTALSDAADAAIRTKVEAL